MSSLPALQLPKPPLFRELDAAQRFLRELAGKVILLSPVVNLDVIPEFHEIAVRYVQVDARIESGDVYAQKGGKGVSLTKTALDRIAGAAGLNWHPTLSGRLDDHSDRHYCHFRAVALYHQTDGSVRPLAREKEIDLRDGHPEIFTTDEKRMKRKWVNGRPAGEIENHGYVAGWSADRLAGAREHILAMAESKAKNRVVRELGVKQVYHPGELERPFAILALVMTGRSEDPELEKEAKRAILSDALGKSRGMFGPDVVSQASLERDVTPGAPPNLLVPHAPPPVGAKPKEDDDLEPETDEPIDVTEEKRQPVCGCPGEFEGKHREGCDGFGPPEGPDWSEL